MYSFEYKKSKGSREYLVDTPSSVSLAGKIAVVLVGQLPFSFYAGLIIGSPALSIGGVLLVVVAIVLMVVEIISD